MTKVCLIITIAFLILSCKKDKPDFNYVESTDITKYVIHLTGNKIDHYSKYLNEVLQQTVYFTDKDSIIEVITKNGTDKVISKCIFFIGSNGYAVSSVDSCFNDTTLAYYYGCSYQYSNEFMVQKTINYKTYGDNSDSVTVIIDYEISGNNIASTRNSFGCRSIYEYKSDFNMIDVSHFSNSILGKINQNLISHVSWNNGCPCGPSSTIAYSDYIYGFYGNNYVSKMIEIYTPCYHSDTEEVIRTVRTTIYEYY